jgi:glycosyltransferase involved in cell wall biosynthesis
MRIAYFSPFPPKQTGIALYSDQMVQELGKLVQIDCFDFGREAYPSAPTAVTDFAQAGRISDLAAYDAVIYQLGNNPYYHLEIFQTLRQCPGIVVLHDVILYYLFAGLGVEGLTKYLWLNYGRARADDIKDIISDSPERNILRYQTPERYPLTASIFPHATRVVVHNRSARDQVLALGCERPVHVLPLLAYPSSDLPAEQNELQALREKYSIRKGALIISCLGFIGPTKRMSQVCRALALLKGKVKFHFLIVGEGDDLAAGVEEANLADCTTRTAFVDDRAFSLHLQLSDIVVNLRYPSMGESSSTLTRAMALRKPCIVSDDGFFADLPAEAVVKIAVGGTEVDDLAAALDQLARDKTRRTALGAAAQRYTETALAASKVAAQFKRIIDLDIKERAEKSLLADVRESRGTEVVASLFRENIVNKLPAQLRNVFGDTIGS